MIDGKIQDNGLRWCEGCAHDHGPLYRCPKYPAAVLAEIDEADARFRANLCSPEWVAEQISRGIKPEAIAIFRMFAGL